MQKNHLIYRYSPLFFCKFYVFAMIIDFDNCMQHIQTFCTCKGAIILERKQNRNVASDVAPEWVATQFLSEITFAPI